MDEKKVKEGCYALAFALFFFPIERNPIYHTAQDIFTQIEAHITPENTKKKRCDVVTVDHLKRGISKLKAAVKHLAKCGYIEISSISCQLPGTLNDEVKDRGKQIKILRRPPVHVLGGGSTHSEQDVRIAIDTMATALFACCTSKGSMKGSHASEVTQARGDYGRFDAAAAPISQPETPHHNTRTKSGKRKRECEADETDHSASPAVVAAVAVSPEDSDVIRKQSDSETSVDAIYSAMDEEAHNFRAWDMKQGETSEEEYSITRASLFEQRMPLTWGAKMASITSHTYSRKNERAARTLAKAQASLVDKIEKYNAASLEFSAIRKTAKKLDNKMKKKDAQKKKKQLKRHKASKRLAHREVNALDTKCDTLEKAIQHFKLQLELAQEKYEYRAKQDDARNVPKFEQHLKTYTVSFLSAWLLHAGEHFESGTLKPKLATLCLDAFESPKAFQDAILEMELTHANAEEKLADEKSKLADKRAARAKRQRVRYARDDRDDDDDDERGRQSDDDEMDIDAMEGAQREVITSSGRKSKMKRREEDATLEEQQREINADKQSRKKQKQNESIRQRQMSIQQSSNGTKSLCTPCAEEYPNMKFCDCFTP